MTAFILSSMTFILLLVILVYRYRSGIYKAWPKLAALALTCLLLTSCQPKIPPLPNPSLPSETQTSHQTWPTSKPVTSPASSPSTWNKAPALSADPRIHPDPLAVRDDRYPDKPVFFSQNHVSRYLLHQFLQGHFDFDFYLESQLAPDEETGFFILNQACQTALSYYLFSAFDVQNMYTKEDPSGRIQAFISLEYLQANLDQKARQAAARFVRENPVPQEGFSDFYSERAYALKIHDFIARKVTYSPLGYNPELMIGMDKYQACQEAYNVLAAEDDTAVCAGYARAFALIAQYAGINCAWVYGNENEDLTESHAWNIIFPCDGSEPVLIDVTWDDTCGLDIHGQEEVCRHYFYIPLSESFEHQPADYVSGFLAFINEGRWVYSNRH